LAREEEHSSEEGVGDHFRENELQESDKKESMSRERGGTWFREGKGRRSRS